MPNCRIICQIWKLNRKTAIFLLRVVFIPYLCTKIEIMLEELCVKNYLSIRDEIHLSFEATKDVLGEANLVVKMPDGKRLLRFAMIYGANASGKSNVLSALDFLRNFWFRKPSDIDAPIRITPFLFDDDTPNMPTEFVVRFYVSGVRYVYSLQVTMRNVVDEKLSYYTSSQPTMIFHRVMKDNKLMLTINPKVIKVSDIELRQLQVVCLPNMSFFAARGNVNIDLPEIDAVRHWMRGQVMSLVHPGVRMFDFAKVRMEDNALLVADLLDVLKTSDFNVTGLKTERVASDMPEELMRRIHDSQDVSDDTKRKMLTMLRTSFEHTISTSSGDRKYELDEGLESRGTLRMIGVETAMIQAFQKGALLPIDEIESSLHPALIEHIIHDFFLKKGESQLLITTHYDYLLDLINDLIRKDSVWFTEKGKDGGTSLYSLVEFSGLNKLHSFQYAYRHGRFGATPNID